MSETSQPNDELVYEYQSRMTPERMAWGVLLLSFALFCLLCVGTSIGVYLFFFESTIPMDVTLEVSRGTVTLTSLDLIPRSERGVRDLTNSTGSLQTDFQSQGTLEFRDPKDLDTLLAFVTIKGNTTINVRGAAAPRFDWSTSTYEINLGNFTGEVDIYVADRAGERDFLLRLLTAGGGRVDLTRSGLYLVEASSTQVRLVAREEGSAVLFGPDPRNNRPVDRNQQATLFLERDEIVVEPAYTNLLENGVFVLMDRPDNEQGVAPVLPTGWGCRDEQDSVPRGFFNVEHFDGRFSMRLLRSDGARSHGETGCLQPLTNGHQDVSAYNFLELHITFLINYQSLSECGVAGSECPLILFMEYVDVEGLTHLWYQGFYYNEDPQNDYPLVIPGVSQEHQKINEKAWYTYETGNIFNVFPEQPNRIERIELYASGHQYDVFISEVALWAGVVPTPVETP